MEKRINRQRECAFTLAEVLLTLGIIGVVAALTLPTLIQETRKKSLEVAFKKSYSNLYNAYNKAMINEPSLWNVANCLEVMAL